MNNEIKEILDNLKDIDKTSILKNNDAKILLDYITNLQRERDKFKLRCYKAYKMIWDNYGVLDKYGIDLLEDILKGKEDDT